MPETKDAFDQWQEWANKHPDSDLSIPTDLHVAVARQSRLSAWAAFFTGLSVAFLALHRFDDLKRRNVSNLN